VFGKLLQRKGGGGRGPERSQGLRGQQNHQNESAMIFAEGLITMFSQWEKKIGGKRGAGGLEVQKNGKSREKSGKNL